MEQQKCEIVRRMSRYRKKVKSNKTIGNILVSPVVDTCQSWQFIEPNNLPSNSF